MHVGTLPLPAADAAQRRQTLQAIARHLSDPVLEALGAALARHADDLVPGRLYTRDGGCAVGVMLRDMFPATCGAAAPAWSRARRRYTVRQETGDLFGADTIRLEHVECCFDKTCRAVRRHNRRMRRGEAARLVGLWMACVLADERWARTRTTRHDAGTVVSAAGAR